MRRFLKIARSRDDESVFLSDQKNYLSRRKIYQVSVFLKQIFRRKKRCIVIEKIFVLYRFVEVNLENDLWGNVVHLMWGNVVHYTEKSNFNLVLILKFFEMQELS